MGNGHASPGAKKPKPPARETSLARAPPLTPAIGASTIGVWMPECGLLEHAPHMELLFIPSRRVISVCMVPMLVENGERGLCHAVVTRRCRPFTTQSHESKPKTNGPRLRQDKLFASVWRLHRRASKNTTSCSSSLGLPRYFSPWFVHTVSHI